MDEVPALCPLHLSTACYEQPAGEGRGVGVGKGTVAAAVKAHTGNVSSSEVSCPHFEDDHVPPLPSQLCWILVIVGVRWRREGEGRGGEGRGGEGRGGEGGEGGEGRGGEMHCLSEVVGYL